MTSPKISALLPLLAVLVASAGVAKAQGTAPDPGADETATEPAAPAVPTAPGQPATPADPGAPGAPGESTAPTEPAPAGESAPGEPAPVAAGGSEATGIGATGSVEVGASSDVAAASASPPLVLGARFGGIFPSVFTKLGTQLTYGLEVGYRLPFMDQRTEILLAAGYAAPGRDYEVTPYEVDVTQKELHFSLGLRVRLLRPGAKLQVTAALGLRLFLLRTTSNGSRDAEHFAEFTEDSTRLGFFAVVGGEYGLGPGAAFLDLELGDSSLPHEITGDISTTNLAAVVGYRLFLL